MSGIEGRLSIGVLLTAFAAHAGWEANLSIEGTPIGGPPDAGLKAVGSGTRLRFDIQRGSMTMTNLFDLAKGNYTRFNSDTKSFQVIPLARGYSSNIGAHLPGPCKTVNAKCMKANGFRKTGSGKVNGLAATKW